MLKVGITGGIGSGKTTVCKIFETLGIPVYYADLQAKELMVSDKVLVAKIKNTFGQEAYDENGLLNRPFLANQVFNNKALLKKLESFVHPAVFLDELNWLKKQQSPYVLKEAAILIESGGYKSCDQVITVFAPKALRISRVAERDKVTKRQIAERINNQLSEKEKIKLAHFVIYNNGKKPLIPQIVAVHKKLLNLNRKLDGNSVT